MISLGRSASGLSMLELLVGFVIFSFAMIPILTFSQSSTRGTYSVGKHMMAGQICASIMDRLLALPYEESLKEAKGLESKDWIEVMNDPLLEKILDAPDLPGSKDQFKEDLKKSFRFFKFKVVTTPGSDSGEKDQLFRLTVLVSWRVDEGSEGSRQSLLLDSIKYKEDL